MWQIDPLEPVDFNFGLIQSKFSKSLLEYSTMFVSYILSESSDIFFVKF